MRSIKYILLTVIIISAAVVCKAQEQRFYIYGELRNSGEKKLSTEMLLSDTIVPPESIKRVMRQCYDSAMTDTDYRRTIGSLARICEYYQRIYDTTAQNIIINKIDSIGRKHKDRNAEIQVFLLRYLECRITGNIDKSIEMLVKGSILAEKINNRNAQSCIYGRLSIMYSINNDTYNCTKYLLDAIKIAEESLDPVIIANIYMQAAEFFLKSKELQMAYAYITCASEVYKIVGDNERLGKSYIITGYTYLERQCYAEALKYLNNGIELLKPTQNKHYIARGYNAAGYIGEQTGHLDFAKKCFIKSMEIRQSIGVETEIIESLASYSEFLINTGGNTDTIINNLSHAYQLAEKYHQVTQMSRIIRNLSEIYAKTGNYQKAYEYSRILFKIHQKDHFHQDPEKLRAMMEFNYDIDKEYAADLIRQSSYETIEKQDNEILFLSICISLGSIALSVLIVVIIKRQKQNNRLIDQKKQIQEKTLELQKKNIELDRISFVAKYTSNGIGIVNSSYVIEWLNQGIINQLDGDGTIDYYMHKPVAQFISPKVVKHFETCFNNNESISFESKWRERKYFQVTLTPYTNRVGRKQIIAVISDITQQKLVEEEIEKKKRELEMQANMMVVINSELSAQKAAISTQNEELENKNREITESLEYARKIQDAIQPMPVFLEAVLNEFFVINFPKNIVSGDFHWFDYHNGNTFIALADCTGHGIPGAFMSMLGTVTLSNIIASLEEANAATVLNQLRDKIIKMLHQRGKFGEAQDGMDISLCIYNEKSHILHYAGAYSYTYLGRFGKPDTQTIEAVAKNDGRIIENDDNDAYIICLKPDRMPIGIHTKDSIPFNDLMLEVKPGDIVYMTSDGFCDQFGGSKNKKFYTANFEKLLLSVLKFDIEKQRQTISDTFLNWKGINEQVDDVHIIGIKL